MTRVISPSDDFDAALASILSQEAAMHEVPRFDPLAIADQARPSRRGLVLGGAVTALVAAAVATGVLLESGGSSKPVPAAVSSLPAGMTMFKLSAPLGTPPQVLDQTVAVLQRRMSSDGLEGVTVQTDGGKVEVIGPDRFEANIQDRTTQGQLSFRQVALQRDATLTADAIASPSGLTWTPVAGITSQWAPDASTVGLYKAIGCAYPAQSTAFSFSAPDTYLAGCNIDGGTVYLLYPTYSAPNDVASVTSVGTRVGTSGVDVYLTLRDPKPLASLTTQVYAAHGSYAIAVDSYVYTVAAPSGPIVDGRVRITSGVAEGISGAAEQADLMAILKSGPLPVPLLPSVEVSGPALTP